MSQKDDFQTIEPNALATVAGGTGQSPSNSTDDQVLTQLTNILNSIQSLGQNNNNQGQFGVPEMMMLFTIMRNNQAQQAAPPASPWGGYPWTYYY